MTNEATATPEVVTEAIVVIDIVESTTTNNLFGWYAVGRGIYRDLRRRLMHENPVALMLWASLMRAWLGGLADQYVVGRWGSTGTDAEQRMECRMPGAASIEAEHELVQVVLEVRPAQSMVDAEAPAFEV